MYDNYIFDLYGTLIDIRTNENTKTLWDRMAIYFGYSKAYYTGSELKKAYRTIVSTELTKAKEISPCEHLDMEILNVFEKLYQEKGVNPSLTLLEETAKTFRCYSTKFIALYDGVIDLLETLKNNNKKIYLLSNAQRSFTQKELEMFGLDSFFDGIFISSDHKMCKPEVQFFEKLISCYKLDKKKSIMIGNDSISDIYGAYQSGIDSLYIHQEISPEIKTPLYSKFSILDGDVYKIKELIL